MKTNKISDAEFIEKYNDGLSHQELSVHFCISSTTVQKYVKRLHLPKRETIDEINRERFTTMWNAGCSLSEIGRKFGLCGTTISRIARKMGLKERKLKRATKTVAYTVVCSKPASIIPKRAKPEEKKEIKVNGFVVPPTLKQLEKQKLQAEIAKAERDYKIFKRDCGFTALKEENQLVD
jgi:Mor family transcriptional regulator